MASKSKISIDEVDFFDFTTYKVYSTLKKDNPNIVLNGMKDVEGFDSPVDIYAPNGIHSLNIEGETVIEVKKNITYSAMKNVEFMFNNHNCNILVIYFNKTISSVDDIVKDGKCLKYIDYKTLKSSSKKKSEDNFYFAKQNKWKENRDKLIEEAREIISQGNNVLFLGAGVSASAKMPSWEELLQSLMSEVSILKKDTLDAFKQLNTHVYEQCGDSNLIMARYLQLAIKLSGNKENFASIIQKHLYSKEHKSVLLTNLAKVIKYKKVNEVITYNFDNILEQELECLGLTESEDFTTIAKDAEVSGHNTLPIYHVHGIIPEKGPTDTIVFSEEEYHERYKDAYHWSNVEQLHAMSRMHCFFIGLSMVDPNLRRLLDISRRINKTDKIGHYAFLRRVKIEDYCITDFKKTCKYMHISESLIDKKKQSDIYMLNYGILEYIYSELGVKVIWFEDFDELPKLVAKVFNLNTYSEINNVDLIDLIEKKLIDLKSLEDNVPKCNPITMNVSDVCKHIVYMNSNSKKYKRLVSEIDEMLNEFSNKIDFNNIEIQNIHKNIPNFNGNICGYYELFSAWFNSVKQLVK